VFAENLLTRSRGGRTIYEALASLTRDGILAMLDTLPRQGPKKARTQVERFVDEFLAFVPNHEAKTQ
jgi:hypothetical protein